MSYHCTVYFIGGPWHGRQTFYPSRPLQSEVKVEALDVMRLLSAMEGREAQPYVLNDDLPLKTGTYSRISLRPPVFEGAEPSSHYTVQAKNVWAADREKNTLTLFWEGWDI